MAQQSKLAAAQPPKHLTPFGYALAGALGGCFSTAYVATPALARRSALNEREGSCIPWIRTSNDTASLCGAEWLRSIKTRIQANEHGEGEDEDLSISGLVASIFKQDGLRGFYRGFGATMLNTFSMRACAYACSLRL